MIYKNFPLGLNLTESCFQMRPFIDFLLRDLMAPEPCSVPYGPSDTNRVQRHQHTVTLELFTESVSSPEHQLPLPHMDGPACTTLQSLPREGSAGLPFHWHLSASEEAMPGQTLPINTFQSFILPMRKGTKWGS